MTKLIAKRVLGIAVTTLIAIVIVISSSYLHAAFSYPLDNPPTTTNSPTYSPINLSSTFQSKLGPITAEIVAATYGINLNGESRTAEEGWPPADVMAQCRLETRRLSIDHWHLTTHPGVNQVDDQYPKCEDFLSDEAKADGWTTSGGDNCEGITSHDCAAVNYTAAGCVYIRLACDSGVVMTKPINATSTWSVSPYYAPTAACADGYNNDTPTYSFVSNPSPQPVAYGRSIDFSNTMNYLLVSGDNPTYYTTIYKRASAGSDTFNQLTTGVGRGFNDEPYTRAAAFTNNDTFLAIGSWESSPLSYLKIYENVSDTFTLLTSPNGPSAQPPNVVNDVDVFQEADGDIYIAATHYSGNRISIYKRTGASSKVFTLLPSALNSYPSDASAVGIGVDFSTDGNYLAVTTSWRGASLPVITVYKRTSATSDVWNKLVSPQGPNAQPNNQGEGLTFSNDGNYLAVAHHGTTPTPYFSIYKKNGDAFELLTDPFDVAPYYYPVNSLSNLWLGVASPSFSPDGNYLAFGDYSSPLANGSLKIYNRTGDSFIKMSNPAYNVTAVYAAKFSSDNQYLYTSFAYLNGTAQKYIALLKRSTGGDFVADYPADPQCGSIYDETESSVEACSDGVNNDGDGLTDYPFDPGCTSARDTTET